MGLQILADSLFCQINTIIRIHQTAAIQLNRFIAIEKFDRVFEPSSIRTNQLEKLLFPMVV
jgi:hypothetical protein